MYTLPGRAPTAARLPVAHPRLRAARAFLRSGTSTTAVSRLKVVIANDRSGVDEETMEKIRNEIQARRACPAMFAPARIWTSAGARFGAPRARHTSMGNALRMVVQVLAAPRTRPHPGRCSQATRAKSRRAREWGYGWCGRAVAEPVRLGIWWRPGCCRAKRQQRRCRTK